MAFVAYRTWVVGELVTAAFMNQDVRDNGEFIADTMELCVPVTGVIEGGVATHPTPLGGNRAVAALTNAADVGICQWICPGNFNALISAYMRVDPSMTNANANWDIRCDMGQVGEAYNAHTEQDMATTYNVVNNVLYDVDFSGILTNLTAGDLVDSTLTLADAAHDVKVICFYMIYSIG